MRDVLSSPPRRAGGPWRALPLVAFAGLLGAGCSQSDECLDNRQFFEQKVWGNVMGKICVKCHSPEGVAAEQNAKLLLLTPAYPAFLDSNYANVAELAKTQYDGRSVLLRKPLGQLSHGGGVVLKEDSEEYKILKELVDRQDNPVTCGDGQAQEAWKQSLTQLSPEATLRKASLDLAGRLPTLAETTRVKAGGEPELRLVLDDMMKEPAFINRVKEIWNDVLLTNRYNAGALNLLNDSDYPGKYWYNPNKLPDNMLTAEQLAQRRYSEIGVASEPLELIAYIVRENKPFKEVLTAPYTMVNPYSARIFNLDPATLGFDDINSYYEFRPATYSIARSGMMVPVPHSGVFTQTVFLRRYPTTTTNLNRHRARMTYKYFLATDILRVAERPIDPSSVTSLNPTRDDPYCKVCHKIIDPVAGTFQKWDQDGRFQPMQAWPTAMPQPGLGTAVLDNVADYPKALSWLGDRITNDPRFSVATVQTIYKGLTGQDALLYPQEDMPDFEEHLTAWRHQQSLFQAIGDAFKKDNYNLKTVFRELVMSEAYRAVAAGGLPPAELDGIGTARLVTPEMLARKVEAITGSKWIWYSNLEWLLTDYNLLYGGINNDTVVERLGAPNGVMAAVGQRLATDMACRLTAYDFTRPQPDRSFFQLVEVTTRPTDIKGNPVPMDEQAIKQNIRVLHQRILGEDLPLEDAEIARTYDLFRGTYDELVKANTTTLLYDCQGRWDRATGYPGATLPMNRIIGDDKNFTIRSWMAVLTYLLSDWRFLYN